MIYLPENCRFDQILFTLKNKQKTFYRHEDMMRGGQCDEILLETYMLLLEPA